MWNFNFLASLCSWGDWFETRFVRNPEDRFSCNEAHMLVVDCDFELDLWLIHYSVYFQDKIDSSEHVDKPPIVGQPPKHIQDIVPG